LALALFEQSLLVCAFQPGHRVARVQSQIDHRGLELRRINLVLASAI
jgi:hypothetical protein